MARLSRATSLDWQEVYGADWQESARLLGCYAVKSFGCWLAEGGFAPSKVFASFLDGGAELDISGEMEDLGMEELASRFHVDVQANQLVEGPIVNPRQA